DAFVAQFYADKPPPRLILLSHTIENRGVLEAALRESAHHAIEIAVPRRGEKRDLVEGAEQNARAALGRKLSETASQTKLLGALAGAFGLAHAPRRIEVYDNSHIMGTNAVGAMIVAGADGFMKTHYRTFNIKDRELAPGDDYAMMREVLRRRFARLMKEDAARPAPGQGDATLNGPDASAGPASDETASDETAFPERPDLILIDGGKGQFDAARGILSELGVTGVT